MIWLAIYLFSIFWHLSTSFYISDYITASIFGFSGILISIIYFRKTEININKKNLLFIFISSLSYATLMPFPYNISGYTALSGCLIIFLFPKKIHKAAVGLFFSSIILFIQQIGIYLFYLISPNFHKIKFVSRLASSLMSILGIKSSSDDWTLNIFTHSLWSFETSPEKLGLYFFILFFMGSIIVFLFSKRKLINFLKLIFILIIFSIFRYILIIALVLQDSNTALFWNNWLLILSFLPLVYILNKFISDKDINDKFIKYFNKLKISISYYTGISFLFMLIIVLLCLLIINNDGINPKKDDRILIDESHSDWEWTDEAPNEEDFDVKSMYNYYAYREYLSHFYPVSTLREPLSKEILDKNDILIIKTPTKPYSEEEIKLITDYVDNGGGLILIGDHTNVFGTSTFINPIAEKFGMKFNFDATYELKTSQLSIFKPTKILPHPIMQNIPILLFLTSCTLESDFTNERVIVGDSLRTAKGDYSQNNFFPKINEKTDYTFGLFNQMSVRIYGKGRVIAFTDSTIFSNFAFYLPYKYQLALNMIEWANTNNDNIKERARFLITIFILFLISLYHTFKKCNKSTILIFIIIAFVSSLPIALYINRELNKYFQKTPIPIKAFKTIVFEQEYSKYFLPIETQMPKDRSAIIYEEFFSNAQRIGCLPIVQNDLKESLNKNSKIIVIINPEKKFTNDIKQKIRQYIENGGSLLIMDDIKHKKSTANQLLKEFGLEFKGEIKNSEIKLLDNDKKITLGKSYNIINAEKNIDKTLLFKEIGKGKLCLFGKSYELSGSNAMTIQKKQTNVSNREIDIQKLQLMIYQKLLN